MKAITFACFLFFFAAPASACGPTDCQAAMEAVRRYVAAQRVAYDFKDYRDWLAATVWDKPPQWTRQTVFKEVDYRDVECEFETCTVHIRYLGIGTGVPYESFKPGFSFHDVYYKVRISGEPLVTSHLPGWFVSGQTVMGALEAAMPSAGEGARITYQRIVEDIQKAMEN